MQKIINATGRPQKIEATTAYVDNIDSYGTEIDIVKPLLVDEIKESVASGGIGVTGDLRVDSMSEATPGNKILVNDILRLAQVDPIADTFQLGTTFYVDDTTKKVVFNSSINYVELTGTGGVYSGTISGTTPYQTGIVYYFKFPFISGGTKSTNTITVDLNTGGPKKLYSRSGAEIQSYVGPSLRYGMFIYDDSVVGFRCLHDSISHTTPHQETACVVSGPTDAGGLPTHLSLDTNQVFIASGTSVSFPMGMRNGDLITETKYIDSSTLVTNSGTDSQHVIYMDIDGTFYESENAKYPQLAIIPPADNTLSDYYFNPSTYKAYRWNGAWTETTRVPIGYLNRSAGVINILKGIPHQAKYMSEIFSISNTGTLYTKDHYLTWLFCKYKVTAFDGGGNSIDLPLDTESIANYVTVLPKQINIRSISSGALYTDSWANPYTTANIIVSVERGI